MHAAVLEGSIGHVELKGNISAFDVSRMLDDTN